MIDPGRIESAVTRTEALTRDRLGLRAPIERQMPRARGMLPPALRRAGLRLGEARRLSGHPRLARLVPAARAEADAAALRAHLERVDPGQRRIGIVLGILGSIVFNLLIFMALLAAFLNWRGLV